MTLLILGLILWSGAHLLQAAGARPARGRWATRARALVAVVVLGSLVLMVLGYREAEVIPVWYPPDLDWCISTTC